MKNMKNMKNVKKREKREKHEKHEKTKRRNNMEKRGKMRNRKENCSASEIKRKSDGLLLLPCFL